MPSPSLVETGVTSRRGAWSRARDGLLFLSTSPVFLIAVALLLLNDWILKDAFGNWVTGKLSDFAGLFAFALFWGALLPRRRGAAIGMTAVVFMVWKSPLSADALTAWNAIGAWPLARVVDYTDWLALTVLYPAYRLLDRLSPLDERGAGARRTPTLRQRATAIATAAVAMVAFMATSRGLPRYPIPDPEGYLVPGGRREVRLALDSLGFHTYETSSARGASAADTLTLYIRQPPERDVYVTIEVHEVPPDDSRIRLLEASTDGPAPNVGSIHRAFQEQVIALLRARATRAADP